MRRLPLQSPTSCLTVDSALVPLVCACVFPGSLVVMAGIFRALRRQSWFLATALSQSTRLLILDHADGVTLRATASGSMRPEARPGPPCRRWRPAAG